MAEDLEQELQAQLEEQQEALEGVCQLLAADPTSQELAELLAELQAGLAETESALLGLTRQRLLAELDALQSSAAEGAGAEGLAQQAERPESGRGGGEDGGGGGSDSGEGSEWEEDGEAAGEEDEEAGVGLGGASYARLSVALAEASDLVRQQVAAGPQSGTTLFFGSEAHSRGIGSKLLAKMGFKGAGHGLGRGQQGMQHALEAVPMKRGAGLGVEESGGIKEGTAKKKRGGKQRRRDKAIQAQQGAEQAEHAAQLELERRTGSVGLFAVLNSIVGDASQAQMVKEANLGVGTSRHGGLFTSGEAAGAPKAAPKEEDRRALAKRADDMAQLRHKVQRLGEMAGRNAKDKVMLPQIKRALGEAQATLAAAERDHAASHKAIHDREKLKKMAKF